MVAAEGRLGRAGGRNVGFPDEPIPHTGIVLRETVFDGVSYVCPTWEQMGQYTFELARQIIESGQSFDRVIALAKGGLTWARTLVDYLQIDEISSVRIISYKGDEKTGVPIVYQPLPHSIKGERVLLLDEVIDTGETVVEAKAHLRKKGAGTADIKIATLCYKPHAMERTGVVADFEAFRTNAWVVFPHEIREFTEGIARKWRIGSPEEGRPGLSDAEIKDRLDRIGLPGEQVEYFLSRMAA